MGATGLLFYSITAYTLYRYIGWPKKVSHYQVPSFHRTKSRQ